MIASLSDSLIAAGAVLVGVLVGGVITLLTTAYFERRRENADNRQARRLVAEELRTIWTHLDLMVQEKKFPSFTRTTARSFLPTDEWDANKSVLARHLSDEIWDALSPFMDSVPSTRVIVEQFIERSVVTIPSDVLARFDDARDLAAESYASLTDGGSPAHA